MTWWKRWTGPLQRKPVEEARTEISDELVAEIWKAHQDWVVARQKLDYAKSHDQIDYAVYIIEAAEKRYDMLLRQAKQQRESGGEGGAEK